MKHRNHIYVIGSINDDIVATTDRHPKPGETVKGTSLHHFPGGKGSNQAVAAARAGAPTSMIGVTGKDAAGETLIEYLRGTGVDTRRILTLAEAPTGTALITVARGENTIVVVPGANDLLASSVLSGIQFEKDDVVIAQFETPIETTIDAFQLAREVGARTVLNPAPAAPVRDDLLAATDYLVVNELEFEAIFGSPAGAASQSRKPPH